MIDALFTPRPQRQGIAPFYELRANAVQFVLDLKMINGFVGSFPGGGEKKRIGLALIAALAGSKRLPGSFGGRPFTHQMSKHLIGGPLENLGQRLAE